MRERLDPLISASPALQSLIGTGKSTKKGSAGGTDSTSLKTFPGGFLALASSHQADELAARAIKYLLLDETDRFARSLPGEGDPVALALKRTKTFEDNGRRVLLVSTPTTRAGSRIDAWYKKGDQRKWFVTCPDKCGHEGPIEFSDIKWDPGKPETAHHVCPGCGVVHGERARRAMVEGGRWVPTATGEKGTRSYHLTELSSLVGSGSAMASVVKQFEAAKTPDEKQTFYNTVLAQAYDAAAEVEMSAVELQQRSEQIAPPYRADMLFVSAGVDVQSNRLEVTFLGHHVDQTLSVLNHFRLPGDTSGDAVWRELDEAMGATFKLEDGRELPVLVQAVDTGFNKDMAVRYTQGQRRKSRSCYAIKGEDGFDEHLLRQGRSHKGQMPLWLVGVDAVKLIVGKGLANTDPMTPGYIRLPVHLDEEYYAGLASEDLKTRTVRNVLKFEWVPNRRRNEPLDCLVYAYAISKHPRLTVPIPSAPTSKSKPAQPSFDELAKRMGALSH
ncbi:terminase gpA endonuclease subunit [Bradyrhizobium sp. USDA 3256]